MDEDWEKVEAWDIAISGEFPTETTSSNGHASKIVTYPLPSFYERSRETTLKVNGKEVPVIFLDSTRWRYDYAQFTMSKGSATIEITTKDKKAIGSWNISPKKYNIQATATNDTLTFTIDEPKYLIIKKNDCPETVLLIDPPEDNIPDPKDQHVRDVTSKKFGADPTGRHYSHKAIQKAIDETSKAGRGTVYIPPGEYICGNLVLKSNVRFYLAGGAYLRYTADPDIYKVHWIHNGWKPFTFWIMTEFHSTNIHVDGRGTIDGNGKYAFSKQHLIGVTPLAPILTQNFLYTGPVVKEASFWTINVIIVQNAEFYDMKILGRHDILNNDGIDFNSCQNILVQRSISIAWDDPYSAKTWEPQRVSGGVFHKIPGPTGPQTNILCQDLVAWTGCFAVKVGEGSKYPQTNITYRNVCVYDAAIAMGIHHRYGKSLLSNIVFEDIEVENLRAPIDYGSRTWYAIFSLDVGEGAGPCANVHTSNIKLYTLGTTPARVNGWDENALMTRITFDNIYVVELGRYAKNLREAGITDLKFVDDAPMLTWS
ncbi:pectin lyase-like protein [Rhizodiscina lignyota]|uniref:Pectin lyase-like protein n=1 Tax=Rhizodiscina lignyota TaxID=1504668 RepID=A0A9P4MBR8_9PEZI|nr:pectin lyase-like protein [Rhizodiscina lignyota]